MDDYVDRMVGESLFDHDMGEEEEDEVKEEEVKEEEIQPEQQPSQPKPSQTPSRSSLPQSRSIKKKEMRNGEYLWILLTRLILSDSLPISIQGSTYLSLSLLID